MESEKIYRYYQWASWMELYFKDNNMEVPVWFKTDEVRNWTYEKWLSRVDFSIDIFKLPIESVALWQNRGTGK